MLILGVGNLLFGDDGFGPATAEYISRNCKLPNDIYVMDVGTGAGDILFTVGLSQKKPQRIIVLDSVHMKRKPGGLFKLSIDDLPASNITDFSLHLFPAANLLKELRDHMGIDIIIVACQAERIPEEVSIGLSDTVKKAVPRAAKMALRLASEGKN